MTFLATELLIGILRMATPLNRPWHGEKVHKQLRFTYSNNNLDSLIERRFRKRGTLSFHLISKHDEKGRLVNESQYNGQKKLTELSIHYDNDTLIERHFVIGDGSVANKTYFYTSVVKLIIGCKSQNQTTIRSTLFRSALTDYLMICVLN